MQSFGHENFPLKPHSLILTDLDGTAMELLPDPKQRRVDSLLYQAFLRFDKISNGHVIPITGRDMEQVWDCFGGAPPFPVISSNGAQLYMPGGTEITHNFTTEELKFIQEMRTEMHRFKEQNPQLVAEVKRFEIGFHNAAAAGYEDQLSPGVINRMAENCMGMVAKLHERAKAKGLPFRIESTEVTHHAFNHANINKLTAMTEFAPYLPALPRGDDWSHVIYMGDCLTYGNDREIAAKVKACGGKVIQVVNGDASRIPDHGDMAEPTYAVMTPQELGLTLTRWIDRLEAYRPDNPQIKLRSLDRQAAQQMPVC